MANAAPRASTTFDDDQPETYRSSRRGAAIAFRPRTLVRVPFPLDALHAVAILVATVFVVELTAAVVDVPIEYVVCVATFSVTLLFEVEGRAMKLFACSAPLWVAPLAFSIEATFGVSNLARGWLIPLVVVGALVGCTVGPVAWRRWISRRVWNADLLVAPLLQVLVGAWLVEGSVLSYDRAAGGEMLMAGGSISLLARFVVIPYAV